MPRSSLWLALTYALAFPLAHAANANRPIILLGDGSSASCATYTLALTHNGPTEGIKWHGEKYASPGRTYVQWLAGFVTGVNTESAFTTAQGAQVEPIDENGLALWVNRYCKSNPNQSLTTAAWHYVMANREAKHAQ